jgi:hypothetical protein
MIGRARRTMGGPFSAIGFRGILLRWPGRSCRPWTRPVSASQAGADSPSGSRTRRSSLRCDVLSQMALHCYGYLPHFTLETSSLGATAPSASSVPLCSRLDRLDCLYSLFISACAFLSALSVRASIGTSSEARVRTDLFLICSFVILAMGFRRHKQTRRSIRSVPS